jgi:hypothetical protein
MTRERIQKNIYSCVASVGWVDVLTENEINSATGFFSIKLTAINQLSPPPSLRACIWGYE